MIDDLDPQEQPSKSQRKREAHAQQALGERLARLPIQKLKRLQLPEELLAALAEFQRLPNSHGARKRQLQFIGKLMRDVDHESISRTLEDLLQGTIRPDVTPKTGGADSDAIGKAILAGDGTAVDALLSRHPLLDRQRLRQFALAHARATDEERPRIEQKLAAYLQAHLH
ncbi:MAG: ribosome biogenesis factor YjgA [Pseudohongiellaceae bacterium]